MVKVQHSRSIGVIGVQRRHRRTRGEHRGGKRSGRISWTLVNFSGQHLRFLRKGERANEQPEAKKLAGKEAAEDAKGVGKRTEDAEEEKAKHWADQSARNGDGCL